MSFFHNSFTISCSALASLALMQTAAQAHYDTPSSTPPTAIKTDIFLDDITITGDVLNASFFSEGEKQEYEFSFRLFYANHPDFKPSKDYFKFESQYNVSAWGSLYMVETRQPQGNPFFPHLPDSEKLIGSHVECKKHEAMSLAVVALEKDLSTSEKVAIALVSLAAGPVAGAAGAISTLAGRGIAAGAALFSIGSAGAQNDDQLGFNAGILPANGTTTITTTGKSGGAIVKIRTVTTDDPSNNAKCAAAATAGSSGTVPTKTARAEEFTPLENTGSVQNRKYAVALESGWKEKLPAGWGGLQYATVARAFRDFRDAYDSAGDLLWEKPMSPEELKMGRALMRQAPLDAARFAAAAMLDQSAGFEGGKNAVAFYRKAAELPSSAAGEAFNLYQRAYQTAYVALHEGQGAQGGADDLLDVVALPRAMSVYPGETVQTIVEVLGLPAEIEGKAFLNIQTAAPFRIAARRVSGLAHTVFLRFDTKGARPGLYRVFLTTKYGQKTATTPLMIHVLPD